MYAWVETAQDKLSGAWIVALHLLLCRCRILRKSLNLAEPHFLPKTRVLITHSLRSHLKSSSILLLHLFCTVAYIYLEEFKLALGFLHAFSSL